MSTTERAGPPVARPAPRQQLVGRRRLLPRIPVSTRPHLPPLALAVVEDERPAPGRPVQPEDARARAVRHAQGAAVVGRLPGADAGHPADRRATDKILTIASTFAIYASINLMWMLIMGTAGIFSLASLAVTGVAAYTACWLIINHDLPWPLMFPVGGVAGLLVGRDHRDTRAAHGRHVLRPADARRRRRSAAPTRCRRGWIGAAVAGIDVRRRRVHPRRHPVHGHRPAARLHRGLPAAARGARDVPARERPAPRAAAARVAEGGRGRQRVDGHRLPARAAGRVPDLVSGARRHRRRSTPATSGPRRCRCSRTDCCCCCSP